MYTVRSGAAAARGSTIYLDTIFCIQKICIFAFTFLCEMPQHIFIYMWVYSTVVEKGDCWVNSNKLSNKNVQQTYIVQSVQSCNAKRVFKGISDTQCKNNENTIQFVYFNTYIL